MFWGDVFGIPASKCGNRDSHSEVIWQDLAGLAARMAIGNRSILAVIGH